MSIIPKPPIGAIPKRFWKLSRFTDLNRAIKEYANSGYDIDPEWVIERNELRKELQDEFEGTLIFIGDVSN